MKLALFSCFSMVGVPSQGGQMREVSGSSWKFFPGSLSLATNPPTLEILFLPCLNHNPNCITKQHAVLSIKLNTSYVSREIHTRQRYCTVFTNFRFIVTQPRQPTTTTCCQKITQQSQIPSHIPWHQRHAEPLVESTPQTIFNVCKSNWYIQCIINTAVAVPVELVGNNKHNLYVCTGWPKKSKPLSRIIIKSY